MYLYSVVSGVAMKDKLMWLIAKKNQLQRTSVTMARPVLGIGTIPLIAATTVISQQSILVGTE